MLMPALKKAIEEKQATRARAKQIIKTPKRRNNGLSDQYKHDDYDTNESQDG